MDDIHKNIEEQSPNKKRKILIVFNDTIVDMLSNKKLNLIVTELFIRGRKLNIYFFFLFLYYFSLPKRIRLHSTNYFIMKILHKRELHQIRMNYLPDTDFKNFINVAQKMYCKSISFFRLILDQIILHNLDTIF